MHHKNEGTWKEPRYCKNCEDNPRERENRQIDSEFLNAQSVRTSSIRRNRQKDGKGTKQETIEEVLERHRVEQDKLTSFKVPNKIQEWKQIYLNRGRTKGESSYHHCFEPRATRNTNHGPEIRSSLGVNDDKEAIRIISELCASEDIKNTCQFVQPRDGNIVILDKQSKLRIILRKSEINIKSNVYYPVTVCPTTLGSLDKKLSEGDWKQLSN